MRTIRTADTREHLCATCPNVKEFPQCIPDEVEFGNGIGNDNIIGCRHCTSQYSSTIYPAELSRCKPDSGCNYCYRLLQD